MIKIQLNKVVGYEDVREYYQVCRDGNECWVEGKDYKKLSHHLDKDGYKIIRIRFNNNKGKNIKQHRLFAMVFISNKERYPVVNHLDGNKQNNLISNLKWDTISGNNKHARDTGLNDVSGERCHLHKLQKTDIPIIFKMYQSGKYLKDIAKIYNVTIQAVWAILNRKSWVKETSGFFTETQINLKGNENEENRN